MTIAGGFRPEQHNHEVDGAGDHVKTHPLQDGDLDLMVDQQSFAKSETWLEHGSDSLPPEDSEIF
jgi:hypothetical protein